jgi:hypothetical protein
MLRHMSFALPWIYLALVCLSGCKIPLGIEPILEPTSN